MGVDAEVGKEVLNSQVNAIINAVQQEGTGATLTGVVSNDETPVAEKIAEAIEAGKNITTEVVVEPVEENAVSAQDKELIAGLAENATIAQYLNLNVVLKAGDEVIGTITQLPEAITYIILIPEELINDNTAFYVVRVHDGAADRLELTHVSDNQYSFTTDRYSTYALAYEVKEDTSSSEMPSSSEVSSTETSSSEAGLDSSSEATTGSSSESGTDAPNTGYSKWLPILLMLVMGAAALTMILVRRRAESK